MSWVRIHDGAMTHPKIVGLPDKAFRLWIWGLSYCQQHLTDGVIPSRALGAGLSRIAAMLILARLWDVQEEGSYHVHDYLNWNDSRVIVAKRQADARERIAIARERRSQNVRANTHVDTLERTSTDVPLRFGLSSSELERECERKPSELKNPAERTVLTEEALGAHAAAFLERYRAMYTELRRGARLKILTGNLDFGRACELLQTWDGAYLERLARIFLTTDEDWISRTDRGFAVFAAKASWCDDRLKAAEHGAT